MRITAIEPQQKNPQRVNIYLDGEFAFGLAAIVATWLKVGQDIDETQAAKLKAEDEREVTYQKALHFLSFRPRSSAEVHQNLIKRGDEWLAALRRNPSPTAFREPIANIVITIDSGQLAYLRADFQVMRDGQSQSKGVDQFTLVREGGVWKLVVIAYTSMPVR